MEIGTVVHCINSEDAEGLEIHRIEGTKPLTPNTPYKVKEKVTGIFRDGPKPAVALENFDEGILFWEQLFEEIA